MPSHSGDPENRDEGAPRASAARAPDRSPAGLTHGLARLVLVAFLLTFMAARVLVIFIMARWLPPELFFHVQGTHVHHLNYGIFLLSVAGGFLIFRRPTGKQLSFAAVIYGIGLALTFDEFGMWLHLGGPYWQRASYDAVVVIAAILAIIAYGATIRRWRPRHWWTVAILAVTLAGFGFVLYKSVGWYGNRVGPLLEQLETRGPS